MPTILHADNAVDAVIPLVRCILRSTKEQIGIPDTGKAQFNSAMLLDWIIWISWVNPSAVEVDNTLDHKSLFFVLTVQTFDGCFINKLG